MAVEQLSVLSSRRGWAGACERRLGEDLAYNGYDLERKAYGAVRVVPTLRKVREGWGTPC